MSTICKSLSKFSLSPPQNPCYSVVSLIYILTDLTFTSLIGRIEFPNDKENSNVLMFLSYKNALVSF